MDRDSLLRAVVAGCAAIVALACLTAAVILEYNGHPTPPFLAGIAGTAVGALHSCLPPFTAPAPTRKGG